MKPQAFIEHLENYRTRSRQFHETMKPVSDPKVAAHSRTCGIPEQHIAKVRGLFTVQLTRCTPHHHTSRPCGLQVWNMAYYSGLVCIAPYMNVYYKRLHISERQIGVLAALSPWVNASSGKPLPCYYCTIVAVAVACSLSGSTTSTLDC